MKRTICLLLALLMVLSLLATTALAEDDGTVPADEPVVTETEAPVEPVAEPPVEPASEPADEPPAEPAAAPASEPADEPAAGPAEEPAAPTEELAAEPTAAPVEEAPAEPAAVPASEPAVEPVAAPPADNGFAPIALPDPEPTEPPYTIVVVHRGEGVFPAPRSAYEQLNVTLTKEGKLPDTTNEKDWYFPQRAGYIFDGWTTDPSGAVSGKKLNVGDAVEPNTNLYPCWKRVVELDAEPGSFNDSDALNNYTRTVELEGNALPTVLPTADPVYDIDAQGEQAVEFTGWYTEKTTVTKTETENGYWTWKIETHGSKIEPGNNVPAGVTTLYAGYEVKGGTPEMREVTFYLDWNGINGMWGNCLSVTRSYSADEGGYKLTAGDLAVRGLNWDGEPDLWGDEYTFDDMTTLETYWAKRTFKGYKFLGWATVPDTKKVEGEYDDLRFNGVKAGYVVKNGQTLYAVWTKDDGTNSWNFVENGGRNVDAGPLQYMRFEDLRPSAHAKKGNTVSVKLVGFPIGAEIKDVTWTLSFTDGTPLGAFKPVEKELADGGSFDGNALDSEGKPKDYGFTATASGGVLTITNTDGLDHGVTVSAVAKSVDSEGNAIDVAAPADAVARFSHSWDVEWTKMPNCTEKGEKTWTCTDPDCGETCTEEVPADGHRYTYYYKDPTCTEPGEDKRICTVCGYIEDKTLPAAGHQYQVTNVEMRGVMKITTELCSVCNDVEVIEEDTSIIKGDVDGNKEVDIFDVLTLHESILGRAAPAKKEAGDTDGDGTIDIFDVLTLHEFILGRTTLG